ncbi:acyl-CoA dehydrogenase [Nocardioides marmoriginsengisoli]|uniref:Acyl-CoA dehydrogenase n=1 Tax=Nocardioides marmoriginsengisoli TaxID=661483 RepID=A0A3N0CCX8_9ACTN|nr:acyl-CoA dehydrogenase family protein [Nocardioides marmoriginsengisoli]RNL61091.1 acyl-CoA dehydrogenase [Nocardioides marmoriginsengisoli]
MSSATPEQQELVEDLRATVRAALSRTEPGTGDAGTWALLVDQVGVDGLLVPEAHGGLGLGARELVAVAEEIGGAAVRVPFLSHAVAAAALLRAADLDAALVDGLRTDTATGSRRIAVVPSSRDAVVADDASGTTRLTGTVTAALDAPGADVLLVQATYDGRSAVCVVDGTAPGLAVAERSVLDLSRSVGSVVFADTPATVLLSGEAARQALADSLRWSRLALAADQVGLARRSLAVTVEYVGIRHQFGAAIGSFQAVKHRCTEVLLEVELAAALVDQAAAALDAGDDPQDLVSTAALQAGTAALAATDAVIQLHGGIGFTWEHVAHHFYRRARANVSLLGPVQDLRDAVAASAGL